MSRFAGMTETELLALIGRPEQDAVRSGSNQFESVDTPHPRAVIEEVLRRHYEWLSRLCLVEFGDPTEAWDCLHYSAR